MMGFELKKLLFKQYALLLMIIIIAVKLVTSVGLFKPDYGELSPAQQEIYLSYVNAFGGTLTDEKEAEIISLYSELLGAKSQREQIENKRTNGEYATTGEYVEALMSVPDIVQNADAIERLYTDYERISADKEHSVLLASDAPAMKTGLEYLLLIFICYISASAIYYERKIENLQKTSINGKKSYIAKLLSLFVIIGIVWTTFTVIELAAVISEIGTENLSASLVSLDGFKNTQYTDLAILQAFFAIESIKLVGYLFTSAVTIILMKTSRNLILSIFTPVAINIVWVYLFSENTIAFFQPFSLMRGAPYFTGALYVGTGTGRYMIHDSVPFTVLCIMLALSAMIIVFACALVLFVVKNKLRIKHVTATIAMLTLMLMLCGCSETNADNANKAFGNASDFVEAGGKKYTIKTETDENNMLVAGYISELDENMNVINDRINRNVFERDFIVEKLYASGGFLYYYATDENGCYINRIDLSDYSEENVYFGDYSVYLGKTKYFDMLTVWNEGNRYDCEVKDYFVEGNSIVFSTQSNIVYSLNISTGVMTYLFEEAEVKNLCTMGGSIYYLNMTGELICFDNTKHPVSDRIFNEIYADEDYIYGENSNNIFRYDKNHTESEIPAVTE